MRKSFIIPVACLAFALGGCASSGQVQQLEESNQRQARDAEYRLKALESSVAALSGQVAQLDNRVYEVRNRNGRKTGMTAVPTTALSSAVQPSVGDEKNSASARLAAMPQARRDNTIKPVIEPRKVQQTEKAAGPSGQIGRVEAPAQASSEIAKRANANTQNTEKSSAVAALALPPMEDPATPGGPTSPMLPAGHSGVPSARLSGEVPVPPIASLDMALPPEQPAAAVKPAAPTPSPAADAMSKSSKNPSAAVKGEATAYKHALKLTRAGRSEEGITCFNEFLQNYPQGRYTVNAHYWIGEALYAQGKYREALAKFQVVSSNYPRHHKSADALLKAGMSLSRLGDKQGAAARYRELLSRFPNSDAAHLVRARGLVH